MSVMRAFPLISAKIVSLPSRRGGRRQLDRANYRVTSEVIEGAFESAHAHQIRQGLDLIMVGAECLVEVREADQQRLGHDSTGRNRETQPPLRPKYVGPIEQR